MGQPDISHEKPHMELRCRVDPTLLGLLRDFVCSVARHLGFSEQEVAEIEISVDEACANAMEHAYEAGDASSKDVQVELYLSADRMTIRISDSGTGEPDLDHPMSMDTYLDINREKFRGLGLVLMRKFMDEVQISATPGKGTVVEMTKLRR
jgi:serine/threonine-protein kinase RsbW